MNALTIRKHAMQIKYARIFRALFSATAKWASSSIHWQMHAKTSMSVKSIYMIASRRNDVITLLAAIDVYERKVAELDIHLTLKHYSAMVSQELNRMCDCRINVNEFFLHTFFFSLMWTELQQMTMNVSSVDTIATNHMNVTIQKVNHWKLIFVTDMLCWGFFSVLFFEIQVLLDINLELIHKVMWIVTEFFGALYLK